MLGKSPCNQHGGRHLTASRPPIKSWQSGRGRDQNQRLHFDAAQRGPAHRERLRPLDDVHRRRVMYKDILVHIPTERPMRPVIDGSISLAASLNAHLDAVAVGYVATSAAYVMEGGAAVAAVFEMERETRSGAGRGGARGVQDRSDERRHFLHMPPARGDAGGCGRLARRDGAAARSQHRAPAGPGARLTRQRCAPRDPVPGGRPGAFPALHFPWCRSRRNGSESAGMAAASQRAPCATPHHSWPAPRRS